MQYLGEIIYLSSSHFRTTESNTDNFAIRHLQLTEFCQPKEIQFFSKAPLAETRFGPLANKYVNMFVYFVLNGHH